MLYSRKGFQSLISRRINMKNHKYNTRFSPFPESYWLTQPVPSFPSFTENEETEIGIIGGGIVGIMTAYLLAKAGKKVTLIEARELISGVTGHTTAKISAQHGLIYDELIQTFGEKSTRLYYEANTKGNELIQEIVQHLKIECNLETKDAVIFATSEKSVEEIEAEARAYEKLDISGRLAYGRVEDLPFPVEATLTMHDQAQFHPVRFLAPLLEEIEQLGGQIYEHSRAIQISEDETVVIMENDAQLTCDKIIVATHYPFNDFNGLYFTKLAISRSYALAAKVDGPIPQAMYLSAESPSRSLRSIQGIDGDEWLLIGGNDHETGKSETPTQTHYNTLKAFGQTWFGLQEVPYHWSAQDMSTLDKVPYIGKMTSSSPNILVATGFNKWGMAIGAFSAQLLTDLIIEEPNPYAELFDPTRSKLKVKDSQQFIKKNTSVAKDFVATKSQQSSMTPDDLSFDEGGLVSINGEKAGGYRDSDGQLHLVKTTCTHLGCGLRWNDAERSWDCACHGSRFSYTGDVLDGPAVKPLEKLEEEE